MMNQNDLGFAEVFFVNMFYKTSGKLAYFHLKLRIDILRF